MSTLKINDGSIKLLVNDDENRVVKFNPTDIGFVERFYKLATDYEAKEKEYRKRAEEIEQQSNDVGAGIALLREVCEDIHARIDQIFGAGTSKSVFDGVVSVETIEQFFNGISPFFENARKEKLQKYTNKNKQGVLK